jgi:hypothetical protein
MMPRTLVLAIVFAFGFSFVGGPVRAQSLAEASAEAAKIKHEWPLSSNAVPVFNPANLPAIAVPAFANVADELKPAPVVKHDEAFWKDRMRTLTTQRANDRTTLAAAVSHERELDKRLHQNADNLAYIRDRLQRTALDGQWNEAVTEVTRLKAQVANDGRAMQDLELEAHQARVPPGWLVIG